MTELKASLVLQLKNMLRGGIAQVRGELKGLKSEAQGLGAIKGPNAAGMAAYGRSAREASQAVRELKRNQAALGAGVGSGNTILAGTGRTALMLGGLYGGAQATRAVVGGTVGQAISFEKAFAQVRKKVDAPDEAGFQDLEKRINRIAVEYGLARAQVAELVAEAGAAGIAFQDLERFMRMTAKAAVAWDMSPQEASQKLAEIKAGTQMTIAEMEVLANKINGLGDNSAAKERDIVEMFGRAGAAAKAAGVNFDVTLAALTAVRSTGLQPEIASRWFSAFTGGLATIDSGTKKQQAGLKLIGLTSKQVSEGMKRDSVGTMIDVFKRLEESPVKAKAALEIFGKEWWDEVSRAGQALPEFRKQLEYLRSGKWGGSLDKTLGIELATTANHLERFKALVSEIGDRMGRWALPPLNSTIDGLIKKFDELQERLANKRQLIDPSADPNWLDGQDPSKAPDVLGVQRAIGRGVDWLGESLFGKKLTKDPSREISAKLLGSAADAEALATKQTEEAALLRIQARNSKAKPDRARLTLEAQKKEQEAQANADAAARARRAAGQASARDMTNVEGGEQQIVTPFSSRVPGLQAEKQRLEELIAKAGRGSVVQDAGSGKFWNVDALKQQLDEVKSKLGEVSGEAEKTGSAVKDKLTLDLTSQGAATAMSWANGLRAGVPAVEAAANALRAPIMTPPAGVPSASRPITGGGASAPARPTNVQVAGIHIHGVQDPEKAARIAEARLASAIRGALSGAHHDGVT
ncbi:MAG: phage tail tape measure protein [Rhizobiales bacterium]|nr:phage tail tape measure protein [Hyphomicrobiales bacterium]